MYMKETEYLSVLLIPALTTNIFCVKINEKMLQPVILYDYTKTCYQNVNFNRFHYHQILI